MKNHTIIKLLFIALLLGGGIYLIWFIKNTHSNIHDSQANTASTINFKKVASSPSSALERPTALGSSNTRPVDEEGNWILEERPLAISQSSEYFSWTKRNLMSENDLKLIATNPLMLERLIMENQWTSKRQIVYLRPKFMTEVKELFNGKRNQLTIAGLDGKELQIDIPTNSITDDSELSSTPEKVNGSFTNLTPNDDGITFSAGIADDCFSLTINKPDGKSIRIEQRIQGKEWVVSEQDQIKKLSLFPPNEGIHLRSPYEVGSPK